MLIILRMLWLRKGIHIYEKKAHEQKNKEATSRAVSCSERVRVRIVETQNKLTD